MPSSPAPALAGYFTPSSAEGTSPIAKQMGRRGRRAAADLFLQYIDQILSDLPG
jgi:hypothetical protein